MIKLRKRHFLSENTIRKPFECQISKCNTSEDQIIAYPSTQLKISFSQRAIMLELDPKPVIKRSCNMLDTFQRQSIATMLGHICCLVTSSASELVLLHLDQREQHAVNIFQFKSSSNNNTLRDIVVQQMKMGKKRRML